MTRAERLRCPVCGATMHVIQSRLSDDGTMRRRRFVCPTCGDRETVRYQAGEVIERWHRDEHDVWIETMHHVTRI